MNDNVFFLAIEAHTKWKIRLQRHLDGTSQEVLDPAVICKDDQCVLGKWIYGDGRGFSSLAHYEELRTTHAEFHKCAAEIVRKTDAGKKGEATALFQTHYSDLSRDITRHLVKMNTIVRDAGK